MNARSDSLLADVQSNILLINSPDRGSTQQTVVIPLLSTGQGLYGVAVDLTWIREFHYRLYWGQTLQGWRDKYIGAQQVETQRDVEDLAIWPLVQLTQTPEDILMAVRGSSQDHFSYQEGVRRVSLKSLRDRFNFEEGVKTTFLQYPELVALIDGVRFRFPEAYFIGDMEPIVQGSTLHRDPDWFRLFSGLPTVWQGRICELCGSADAAVQHIVGPARIVRCRRCDLEYDNPQSIIPKEALDKYASPIHDRKKSAKSMVRAEQNAEILIKGLKAVDESLLGQPLLDIGCASGELLYVLRERYHWSNDHLQGVEPSRLSAEIAQTKYGLHVLNAEIAEAEFPKESFMIAVIFNTFEHLAQPRMVLSQIYELLAPEGYLLIGTVPNTSSLAATLFPEGFIAKNFPDGQHHYHYTPHTLTRLCQEEGFIVLWLDGETRESVLNKPYETAIWLAYSCGVPLDLCRNERSMLDELEKRINIIRNYNPEMQEDAYYSDHKNFENSETLIRFWKRAIWPSPYLSDEFDLWLKK